MSNNFITNDPRTKNLKTRIEQLARHSGELKFLSGFFYFSGWQEIYQNIKDREDLTIKILVGLEVDKTLGQTCEIGNNNKSLTKLEKADNFFSSLEKAINSEDMDTKPFYEQIKYFLQLIEQDKLQIRKTAEPNHSKLYIFKLKSDLAEIEPIRFITGSSNLTKAGIETQNEFNVEISNYGTDKAEQYFNDLWERAVPITEKDERKYRLIKFIKDKSQVAEVTPFEAYAFALKMYIELQEQKQIKPQLLNLLEKKGYKTYSYQLDAVSQALTIIESYNGVIIADVVGLGKSIIASMIAKSLGKRGIIISPPHLIGDKNANSGWEKYKHDFELFDWEVRSCGKMEEIAEYLQNQGEDIEVIIIDESHRFRNQDTIDYEYLSAICRNKIVILLTATPFNNTPADIFSLLKRFIVPAKSGITLDDDLERRFASYEFLFKRLSFIAKHQNTSDIQKLQKAENYYKIIFNEEVIDIKKVQNRSKELAHEIRLILEPILIRRNRIDLKNDWQYKKEIKELSKVKNPQELLFELSSEQSELYDKIIEKYFCEGGKFCGAIYQPFNYEKEHKKIGEKENREFIQQKNLYDFMRRLLVKRFESSFGAFYQSIINFEKIHRKILEFIKNSGGKYILDRGLIDKIYEFDENEIEQYLEEFANKLEEKKAPKNDRIYNVNKFKYENSFIEDIKKDLELFISLRKELDELDLVNNDPKRKQIISSIKEILDKEPDRKIIIFTEYVDTVNHLKKELSEAFNNRVLVADGNLNKTLVDKIYENFDASFAKQKDDFDILLTSDRLSEGFNLNRAGAIINYDIPWNPTRVIQRVGRINRIGKKVFDELYLYNFFPTIQGSDVIKSREIASQKMFLIHNTLGEDIRIFAEEETPTPSDLFKKLQQNPEENEEESLLTSIRNRYKDIEDKYPSIIEKINDLPVRIKTAKSYNEHQVVVLRKKGIGLFVQVGYEDKISYLTFDRVLENIECEIDTPRLEYSDSFWDIYEKIKSEKPHFSHGKTDQSLEVKAENNLNSALNYHSDKISEHIPFIKVLLKDVREYKTLNKYTLRRLSANELTPKTSDKVIESFKKELDYIKQKFGENYLEPIEQKSKNLKTEVIVAIENVMK